MEKARSYIRLTVTIGKFSFWKNQGPWLIYHNFVIGSVKACLTSVQGEVDLNGLGKGLGALLSDDGIASSRKASPRKLIQEKERELKELVEEIKKIRKEADELRKELTIKLMLEGKVDKRELFKLDEELKYRLDKKEALEIEIENLRAQMRSFVAAPPEQGSGKLPGPRLENGSSEIDLEMVKELMFSGSSPTGDAEDDRAHLDDLKAELDSTREAERVRKEAYGDVPGDSTRGPAEEKKVVPIKIHTFVKPGKAQPRRVRVLRGTKEPGRVVKDRRMYDYIDEAQAYFMEEDPESAKNVLTRALREYPLDDELLYHLGNANFLEGDLDSAEARFRKATEVNPKSYRAFNNLGVVLKKKGENEGAIQAFNQALEINESYERAWLNLGKIFMEIEPPMLKEARIFLRRALECNPELKSAREKLEECEVRLAAGS